MTGNILSEIADYLRMKNVYLSTTNEWLSGCCNFYPNNIERQNIRNLQTFVYEQWLLADLHDVAEACLPPNLNEVEKTILRGKYTLQVDMILNVNESYYMQLKNIDTFSHQYRNAENVEPKRRMLRLTCTDGVQMVYAVEYEPLSQLQDPFIPGFKISVIGPIECRRGVLLLTTANLIVLGGEADNLIDENCTRKVLSTILNTTTNVDSCSRKETSVFVERASERNDGGYMPKNSRIFNEEVTGPPIIPEDVDNHFDDDVVSNLNLEHFDNTVITDANDRQISNLNRSQDYGTAAIKTKDLISERDTLASSKKELTTAFHRKSNRMTAPVIGIVCPIVSSNNQKSWSKMDVDSFTSGTVASRALSCEHDRNTFPNSQCPISTTVSATGIVSSTMAADNKSICHARVCRLTSRPRIRNGLWQLSAEISDKNATRSTIPVSFSNSVLETAFGYSALEISSQRERMKFNSNVKERIDQILKEGVEKILSLEGVFKLQHSQNNNQFIVTKVISKAE